MCSGEDHGGVQKCILKFGVGLEQLLAKKIDVLYVPEQRDIGRVSGEMWEMKSLNERHPFNIIVQSTWITRYVEDAVTLDVSNLDVGSQMMY